MPIPFKSYMKLKDGADSGSSTIYTNSVIKVGDTLRISGTASNNGVFTVRGINLTGTDVYYALKGRPIAGEDSAGSTDPVIDVIRATGDKLIAMGDVDGAGNIDVWSTNATTDYTTAGNGYQVEEINPTLSGDNAKYIYLFIDEALRVCNIEEGCESRIKWYGYIQRHQFGKANTGLSPTFAEWQEHPNTLRPPKVTGALTYSFGGTNFTANTAGNFYLVSSDKSRGVSIKKQTLHSDESTIADTRIDKPRIAEMSSILSSAQKTFFADILDADDNTFDFGGNNGDGNSNVLDSDGFVSDETKTVSFTSDETKGIVTNTSSNRGICTLAITTVIGKTYQLSVDGAGSSTSTVVIGLGATIVGSTATTGTMATSAASYNSAHFTATGTTSYLQIVLQSATSGHLCNIDNLTVSLVENFSFENTEDVQVLDVATVGEVITIDEAQGTAPLEYLLCIQESGTAGLPPKYKRSYGGSLVGTAPDIYADTDTPILERGVGWNISVTDGTLDGQWLPDTYEFYETYIYDGNQESLPAQIGNGAATIVAFTHPAAGGKSLRVAVYADLAYNGRITGGRIYIRSQGSDDDLVLLVDIDIESGVRTSLSGDFTSWTLAGGKGYEVIPAATGNSNSPNLDTYSSINGYSYQSKFISIGGVNEMYKDVVIANRRAFIVNVKTAGFTGEVEKYGDRLMYSEINKFDTFVKDNFIDVSKGDYGEYVAIKTFADRLLAFKHNLVHVINIANPSPTGWYLEDTIKYAGVNYRYSVTNTKYGVAWVSDSGCYLYDGEKVTNLIEKKLGVNDITNSESTGGLIFRWSDFANGNSNVKDPMIGYDSMSNSLVIVRSPSNGTTYSNNGFIYDFNTNGWTHITSGLLSAGGSYTNFFTDWNNNLCISDGSFHKFLQVPLAADDQKLYTRDIDFGDPSTVKKVYAVTITYKSSVGQANPLQYAKGGKQSFSSFATKTLSATTDWDIATFTASSPISCNSIQFYLEPPDSGTFELNEISIEYRIIRGKTQADG